jgi:hypothetical protein
MMFALPPLAAADAGRDVRCAHQEQDNWCWAACIQMILSTTGDVEQSEIVNNALGRDDCATDGSSEGCNLALQVSGSTPTILSALGANGLTGTPDRRPGPDELLSALTISPAIASFDTGGATRHVVLIVDAIGGSGDNPDLFVFDPGPSPCQSQTVSYDALFGGSNLGMWSETIHSIR